MTKPLVIVESPAKAKTISKILGSDYRIEASVGHIRDLPDKDEMPEEYKARPWARLAVDVENDFRPIYVVSGERARKQVRLLKQAMKEADELYLATDEDREGEAIAWHIVDELRPKIPVKRMVFHEITAKAIKAAVEQPRDIDMALVEAQEARRVLDRLVGYEVSPVLWRRIMPGLSAGRVQSVAVRLVVERERERIRFVPASFSGVEATITVDGGNFTAALRTFDGTEVATGDDFGPDGQLKKGRDRIVIDGSKASSLASALDGSQVEIASLSSRPYKRAPQPPFITSTLQRAAASKYGFSAQRTMSAAQGLYENGYITYMRTDSVTLSDEAVGAARNLIEQRFGADAMPAKPRTYPNKSRNAQEAHEAIRPAGEAFRNPEDVRGEVNGDEAKIYDLVYRRTIASQMKDAIGETLSVEVAGQAAASSLTLAASGTTITDPGYRRILEDDEDDAKSNDDSKAKVLPPLHEGQTGRAGPVSSKDSETKPPNRYSEAGLIKALEELGVGRPSTYASIMNTIVRDRGYLWKKGSSLIPSWKAFSVVGLLEEYFPRLVDYRFTAKMENDLDEIADGDLERVDYLRAFYEGDGSLEGLRDLVGEERLAQIDAREINTIPIGEDEDGRQVALRVGRYGPYVERGEDRASVPEELPPDELTLAKALELLSAGGDDGRLLGVDPETGLEVRARSGRYGPYFTLGSTDEKPVKTASLLGSMSLDEVTLEDGLRCLSLPRTVGVDPDSGTAIEALNGRYGPYLKRGDESRSLNSEEELFTVTVEQALELFKQPPRRRGARAPAKPLLELGPDPVSGKPMVVKDGRWGPYVTDGETNASLKRGDDPATLTVTRAAELLADRRAAGPGKGKRKAGAKKTSATKTGAKKKAPAKKGAAKKKAPAKKPPS
ncbi:MAG: type I DNA topoisomerase [Actinomycetota bacterium]